MNLHFFNFADFNDGEQFESEKPCKKKRLILKNLRLTEGSRDFVISLSLTFEIINDKK